MLKQNLLFDDDIAPSLARRRDPDTSQQAAEDLTPQLGRVQMEVLAVIRRSRSTLTANEAAEIARRCASMDGKLAETYRKRLGELERRGFVRVVGKRTCSITGKTVQAYTATEQ